MKRHSTPMSAQLRIGGFILFAAGIGLLEWAEAREIQGGLLSLAGLLLFAVSFPTAALESIRQDIQKRDKRPDREKV